MIVCFLQFKGYMKYAKNLKQILFSHRFFFKQKKSQRHFERRETTSVVHHIENSI